MRKMTARPTVRAPAPTTVLVPGLALVLGMALALLGGVYMYPVGGRIWSAAQVSGVALVRDGRREELTDAAALPHAVQDALTAARLDRFRRLAPARGGRPCVPQDIALRVGGEWVDVQLRCSDGLLFDHIAREAWR